MNEKKTFFWYDLETFGLNPYYDRIVQFAGIRTDMDLNPVGQPVLLYARPSIDYLPDPLSCLVTGITPQEAMEKGLRESDFADAVLKELGRKNTCSVGFNSIRFDDEFIRNLLYRNLLDPYRREWADGNSRWDVLDLIRAAHDLRPDSLAWPPSKDNGNPVFKLTELTAANTISHEHAHDALSDVYATLAVSRLLKEKNPQLFTWALGLRDKKKVKEIVNPPFGTPFLHTCASFTTPQGCTRPVVAISVVPSNPNSVICFDLTQDLDPLLAAGEDDIMRVPGVLRIALNKCPFVSPLSVLGKDDAISRRLGIDMKLAMARYDRIRQEITLPSRFRSAVEGDEYEQVSDPDFRIYAGGFFSDADRERFAVVRRTEVNQKLSLNLRFDDPRAPEMVWRYVCRSWPETLDEQQKARWKSFAANRILNPPGDIMVTWQFYTRKINEKLQSSDTPAQEKPVLIALKEWGEHIEREVFQS